MEQVLVECPSWPVSQNSPNADAELFLPHLESARILDYSASEISIDKGVRGLDGIEDLGLRRVVLDLVDQTSVEHRLYPAQSSDRIISWCSDRDWGGNRRRRRC